jgi:hypothetical protein
MAYYRNFLFAQREDLENAIINGTISKSAGEAFLNKYKNDFKHCYKMLDFKADIGVDLGLRAKQMADHKKQMDAQAATVDKTEGKFKRPILSLTQNSGDKDPSDEHKDSHDLLTSILGRLNDSPHLKEGAVKVSAGPPELTSSAGVGSSTTLAQTLPSERSKYRTSQKSSLAVSAAQKVIDPNVVSAHTTKTPSGPSLPPKKGKKQRKKGNSSGLSLEKPNTNSVSPNVSPPASTNSGLKKMNTPMPSQKNSSSANTKKSFPPPSAKKGSGKKSSQV